ncbi:MAG: aspartyl protease family protein [Dehalococcoidia bacterium]|nr:hypothetical protein [Chloroflexota bacterium]
MGHSYVSLTIYDKTLSRSRKVSLLVDTGSTYSWIRKDVLEGLGLAAEGKWRFKTIEGREIEREIGEAVVEYEGLRATTIVVFALEEDAQALGVYTLEGLRLEVDPISERLKRAEVVLAI